jgi:hypothetical protein
MTGRFNRPCLTCGVLTRGTSYCDTHKPVKPESERRKQIKRERYDSTYRRLAKHVRETTTVCHICGGGPRLDDPWEADHVNPHDPAMKYVLAGAHRSCNRKKSNKIK